MKKDIVKQIIEAISDLPACFAYCSHHSCMKWDDGYICPEKQEWLKKLKSEIEKILEK